MFFIEISLLVSFTQKNSPWNIANVFTLTKKIKRQVTFHITAAIQGEATSLSVHLQTTPLGLWSAKHLRGTLSKGCSSGRQDW